MHYRSPAHEALMAYQQADEDGVMVLVSRQAIHEVSDELVAAQVKLKDIIDHASGTLEMDDGEKGYAVHSDFIFAAEELLKKINI